MKPVSTSMNELLAGYQFFAADLYTITLANGDVYHYTSGDGDIQLGSPAMTPINLTAVNPKFTAQSTSMVFVAGDGVIYAIDKATLAITSIVTGLPIVTGTDTYGGIVFDGANFWAIHSTAGLSGVFGVNKYMPDGALLGSFSSGFSGIPYRITFGGGYIYTVTSAGMFYKLDLSGAIVASQVNMAGSAVSYLYHDGVFLWSGESGGYLDKYDSSLTLISTTLIIAGGLRGITGDGTYIWVTSASMNSIAKIDRATGALLATYSGFTTPTFIELMPNGYLAVSCDGSVEYVNPATGAIVATVTALYPQQVIVDGDGKLYIPNSSANTVTVQSDLMSLGVQSFVVGDLRIERSDITIATGVSVDESTVSLYCNTEPVFNGLTAQSFAVIGGFDNAHIKIELAIMPSYGDTSIGVLHLFEGYVSDIKVDISKVELTVSSESIRLDTQIPSLVYQPSCTHTLYDSGCALSRAPFTASCTVVIGSNKSNLLFVDVNGVGFFDLGKVTFTSGLNNALTRTVKAHTVGMVSVVALTENLPFQPAVGDTFIITAGCDKLRSTCTAKFNNAVHFLGWEYMPVPEASL
jgi:uncharacterized phage protein (TIGR02218 family)